MTAAELARRFKGRRSGKSWFIRCRAHGPERTPSLRVSTGDKGQVLLYCFGCQAPAEDLADALGLDMADLFPDGRKPRTGTWRDRLYGPDLEACERLERLARGVRRIERQWDRENDAAWRVAFPGLAHMGREEIDEMFVWIQELYGEAGLT